MSLFGKQGLLPHGYCLTWSPRLLGAMVGADTVIALAYFSIPLAMLRFARKRGDSSINGLIGLFSAFIFACGLTHVMDAWTVWQPYYGLQAISKVVTAAISMGTAILLWRLIPGALKIPSVSQLQAVIGSLEAEIKQRRSAEEGLADTQEALLITLASIGAGFIATDRDGRVTRVNAIAEQLTGWSQSEARGQSIWQVFAREGRPADFETQNPVDVMISTGANIDTAHHVMGIHRDGTRTPLEVKAALTYSSDQQVRGLAMVLRDMTQMNQAQAKVNQLAAIVASSHDAIISKTLDGHITSWNQAAQTLFGYPAEEAIGQAIQMLIPPDRVHEEMLILARLSAGIRVPAFDTVRRCRDGRLIDVSVTISPIQDAQGHIVGASKIVRDISHQKITDALRLEAQRLEAENLQILEASRLKSEFLANMSHELRTPLNAIIGFADLLHAGAVPVQSPKHQAFLGHIGTSGRHLLQLINDVLDLSKVEAGKLSFFAEPVNLPQLVKEVTDILDTAANRAGVNLQVDIDDGVANLTLDPARLKQVLYNYLSNAIKFTPAGGLVTLRARPDGETDVRIEVEDTGIGIKPSELSLLFVEFQQLDSGLTKRHQGTGLGLALTRRLVQAQGGTVGVRSTPGVGSVFHLVLPRQPENAATHRVLVIQDETAERLRMHSGLNTAGFAVDTAPTGQQAIACANAQRYDAIALDLRLPDQAGLEALSHIRREGLSTETPVVAMSMTPDASMAAVFAITDVLCKPIVTQQLIQAFNKIGLQAHGRRRVMVVDDDPLALTLMEATLGTLGITSICLTDGQQALQELDMHRPDAIVLDLMMPGFDGFSVLDALQHMPAWRKTPVFIWTSMILTDAEYAHLAQSARAILQKGGGSLDALLEELRQWRPSAMTVTESDA